MRHAARPQTHRRWVLGALTVVSTVLATLAAVVTTSAPAGATPAPTSFQSTPIASWRTDGVGYATLLVGDTVYVGGTFANVTSPDGATVVPRANLAAFDVNTGALKTAFVANTNGIVRSLATDGTSLFVGGSFTTINGSTRQRLAALNLTTGTPVSGWLANTNSTVYALAVSGSSLYLGGSFSLVKSVARLRVGAVATASGALLPYAPTANNTVSSLDADPAGSAVYLGGDFTTLNGVATPWVAKTDGNGVLQPLGWTGIDGKPIDIELNADGTRLAMAQGGAGNQGALYDTATGSRLWRQRCDGDGQAVHIIGGTLFSGFHEACEQNTALRLTANAVDDGSRDLDFAPVFDNFWGIRAIHGDAQHLVVAGDFTTVSGVAVQGFAIFPPRTVVPGPAALPTAAGWRYNDTGVEVPGWNQPGFDDTSWPVGAAQLGYGDNDERTVVGYGPNPTAKYPTTWFRTTFDAADDLASLTLRLLADDGAVVYLNGVEVARDNLPATPITPTTKATVSRSGAEEQLFRTFAIDPTVAHVGTNVLAVEVHQDVLASTDLSFAAALSSTAYTPPLYIDAFDQPNGPWPGAWTTESVLGGATLSDGAGRLLANDVAGSYSRARLDGAALAVDTDVVFSYQWSATGPAANFTMYLRGAGGWQNSFRPRTGYGIEFSSSSGTVAVRRNVNGTVTNLATVSGGQAVTTQKQWVRIRAVGTTFAFKTWLDGQPQPAAWKASITDTAIATPGRLHLSMLRAANDVGAKEVIIDDLKITDGTRP